jgi:hypothetical protein
MDLFVQMMSMPLLYVVLVYHVQMCSASSDSVTTPGGVDGKQLMSFPAS